MNDLPPQTRSAAAIAEALVYLVQGMIRAAARSSSPTPLRRNRTLRPGPGTPHWNALVLAVRPHLRRRGSKINLARELGLPGQRVNEFFVARTATPDAERTLALLHWLATRPPLPVRRTGGTPQI